jgi:hypothetical protein
VFQFVIEGNAHGHDWSPRRHFGDALASSNIRYQGISK